MSSVLVVGWITAMSEWDMGGDSAERKQITLVHVTLQGGVGCVLHVCMGRENVCWGVGRL